MAERAQLAVKKPEVKSGNSAIYTQKSDHSLSLSSTAERILFLQRTAGNQAVQRLIKSGALQAKLRIGQPGDKYEQEAGRVAEAVMRMPDPGVQRQVEPEDEEEETLQAKPLVEKITPLVQRQVEPEEEEEEELKAKTTSGHISEVNTNLESHIHSLKGGGKPLPESERAYFEPRFGHDFSRVRVHTDSRAAEIARLINAKAFTTGKNIVFSNGQHSPGTSTGRRLLAHELTHVIQQRKGIHNDFAVLQTQEKGAKLIKTRPVTSKDYMRLYYILILKLLLKGLWDQLQQKVQEHRHYLLALSCLAKAAGRGGDSLKVAQFCKKYKLVLTMPVVGLIPRLLKRLPNVYAVTMGIKIIAAMTPLLTKIRMRNAQLFALDTSIVPEADTSDVGIILESAESPRAVMQAAKKKGVEVDRLKKKVERYSARLKRIETSLRK